MSRLLGLLAGPFHIALPLSSVHQIAALDGVQAAPTPTPEATFVPHLAEVLGGARRAESAALCLEGPGGFFRVQTCSLTGVFAEEVPIHPLPATVSTRWPGLLRGTARNPQCGVLHLVLDPGFLCGMVEVARPRAAPAPRAPQT